MKKILALLLSAVLICSTAVLFAGCGSSNGELHMATNAAFEPYEYKEGGEVVGIDAELAQAICDKLGYKLVIDDMEFDAIITAVSSGKADFGMAGMTVTEERKKSVEQVRAIGPDFRIEVFSYIIRGEETQEKEAT